MINFLSRFVQEDLSDFGNLDAADDMLLDVQTITDAMMTTAQKIGELGIRFALNLLVCWLLVHFFYYRKSRRRDYYFTFIVFSSYPVRIFALTGFEEDSTMLLATEQTFFGSLRRALPSPFFVTLGTGQAMLMSMRARRPPSLAQTASTASEKSSGFAPKSCTATGQSRFRIPAVNSRQGLIHSSRVRSMVLFTAPLPSKRQALK